MVFGLDSVSQRTRETYKNMTISNRDIIDKLRYIKKSGLKICLNLILGLPGEDDHTWEATVAFMEKIRPDRVSATPLTIYPGTVLENQFQLPGDAFINTGSRRILAFDPKDREIFHRIEYLRMTYQGTFSVLEFYR
jgi:radical SAM superfamily enzyme YgiQ (UPF0313 family)